MMKQVWGLALLSAFLVGSVLLGINGAGQSVQASPAEQVPTPTRPPMLPVATPSPIVVPTSQPKPVGGLIELDIRAVEARQVWTVVQWQDNLSNWHDVEGWQGTPDQDNRVIWWVASSDLGKGPFRWIVYQSWGGKLLAVSEPFRLPSYSGSVVRVDVRLSR